jgi:hypothetical protein
MSTSGYDSPEFPLPNHTSILPEAPPEPEIITFTRSPLKQAGVAIGMVLTFALGGLAGFGAGAWVAEAPAPVVNPAMDPKPAPAPTASISQEVLDQKVERAAFYTGRGQPDGGSQILTDMLKGTGCEVISARWGATDTRAEAEQASAAFMGSQPKGALASVAVVKSERPDLAGGKYVGTAVSLNCPEAP